MYCPKCGQQQISDDARFCSRCGLSLSGLAEWVADDGVLAVREDKAPMVSTSPRRKGIKRGGKLMFLGCAMVPIFFGLCILVDSPGPLLIPFAIFFVGLLLILYARIFGEEIPHVKSQQTQPSRLGTMFGSTALPPASTLRMNSVGEQRMRTAEIIRPPSVTENTTKLLDRD